MKASIVKIGNSKGIRIPKVLLEESQLPTDVELKAKRGEIRIVPAPRKTKDDSTKTAKMRAMMMAYGPSYSALAKEWDTPEEDAAWAHLQ